MQIPLQPFVSYFLRPFADDIRCCSSSKAIFFIFVVRINFYDADIDQLITISGMVIRTSNLIPEMRAGEHLVFSI